MTEHEFKMTTGPMGLNVTVQLNNLGGDSTETRITLEPNEGFQGFVEGDELADLFIEVSGSIEQGELATAFRFIADSIDSVRSPVDDETREIAGAVYAQVIGSDAGITWEELNREADAEPTGERARIRDEYLRHAAALMRISAS